MAPLPYRVVVTGSHPEYWSAMLDALDEWQRQGGRLISGRRFIGVSHLAIIGQGRSNCGVLKMACGIGKRVTVKLPRLGC